MPTQHRVTVVVDGSEEAVARATHAIRGTSRACCGDGRYRVEMGADSPEWLAFVVAELALGHDLEVEAPPEVTEVLERLADRLVRLGGGVGHSRAVVTITVV